MVNNLKGENSQQLRLLVKEQERQIDQLRTELQYMAHIQSQSTFLRRNFRSFLLLLSSAAVAFAFSSIFLQFFTDIRGDASKAQEEVNQLIATVAEDFGSVLFAVDEIISCTCSQEEDGCDQSTYSFSENELNSLGRSQLYVSVQASRLFPNSQFSDGYGFMVQQLIQHSRQASELSPSQCEAFIEQHDSLKLEVREFLSLLDS